MYRRIGGREVTSRAVFVLEGVVIFWVVWWGRLEKTFRLLCFADEILRDEHN